MWGANAQLSTFSFTEVNVSHQSLKVNCIKVYNEIVNKRQIILGLQTSFAENSEISLEIKQYFCRPGMKSIPIYWTMWVTLEPLIGDIPLVWNIVHLLRKTLLENNWMGQAGLLDIAELVVYQIVSF